MAKLKDIGVIITGNTPKTSDPKNYETTDIPFIKPSDISDNAISYLHNSEFYISEYAREKSRIVPVDSILFTCIGIIGKIAVNKVECAFNQQINAIIPDKSKCLTDYLVYALQSKKRLLQETANAPVVPILNKTQFSEIEIELPSLEQQEKISVQLNKINDLISQHNLQLSKLDELVKSRFIEMFGDPVINDKNWIIDTLGNYMTTLTDFSANGSYELLDSNVVMYDEPNYAIMVRTTDLESDDLTSGVKYIDEAAYKLLDKSKLFGGELIMNKIGSAGKIYIMPHIDQPASLGRNAFMFRFDERLNMKYLYFLLLSDYGTNEIQQYVRGAVTKTITKDSTRAIKIIVPPIDLQNQFATFVEQTDKSKLAVQQSLEKLETLKKSLMQQYFG